MAHIPWPLSQSNPRNCIIQCLVFNKTSSNDKQAQYQSLLKMTFENQSETALERSHLTETFLFLRSQEHTPGHVYAAL